MSFELERPFLKAEGARTAETCRTNLGTHPVKEAVFMILKAKNPFNIQLSAVEMI